jgi:hypothetical protein
VGSNPTATDVSSVAPQTQCGLTHGFGCPSVTKVVFQAADEKGKPTGQRQRVATLTEVELHFHQLAADNHSVSVSGMEYPANIDNHFVVDPSKYDFT